MIDNGRVQGNRESAVPVWKPCDKWVYVHSNIELVDAEQDLWEYDEVQYSAEEYRDLMVEKLEQQNIDIQMALIELAEDI